MQPAQQACFHKRYYSGADWMDLLVLMYWRPKDKFAYLYVRVWIWASSNIGCGCWLREFYPEYSRRGRAGVSITDIAKLGPTTREHSYLGHKFIQQNCIDCELVCRILQIILCLKSFCHFHKQNKICFILLVFISKLFTESVPRPIEFISRNFCLCVV